MTVPQNLEAPNPQIVRGWKRVAYFIAAGFFVVLGTLGVFLPGLPATPFLMLASYFLIRTSPKAHQALLNSRLFGPILVDWQMNGGIRRHVKQKATVFVALTVTASIWLTGTSIILMCSTIALAAVGLVVVWKLPDVQPSRIVNHGHSTKPANVNKTSKLPSETETPIQPM
ncbi:MAG: YbaN family protein [Fuerstiella sp.]